MKRRSFLKTAASAGAMGAMGGFGFLSRLPSVSAGEAVLDPRRVRLDAGIEPLVRFLEETPRERLIEETAARVKRGLSYRDLLAALLLAGVRNIQPRPVGFKFHAVLVVNSAHLASLSSPDKDRWLPIFWALDQFKSSQAADVREGDWTLGPVDEPAVPPGHKARQALIQALDAWDEAAADAAIVGMVRTTGAHEIFEVLARYGVRDFREIGHKEIYVANSFRTLEVIGWHHAEPVLRSVVYAILDRDGEKANPSKADLPPDRPFRRNKELEKSIRSGWLDGKRDSDAAAELLRAIRDGSAVDTSETTVGLLNRGVSPRSIFDALFTGAGELLMRAPGILSLHAATFTNAAHYAWQHTRDDETRRLLLLQNAAFLPLFRGKSQDKGLHIDRMAPLEMKAGEGITLEDVFDTISRDRLLAARKVLAYLQAHGDPKPLIDAGRRQTFLKGRDSHDYKFTSAVWEDCQVMAPAARDRYLAVSVFNLKGSGDSDNGLVERIRAALGA